MLASDMPDVVTYNRCMLICWSVVFHHALFLVWILAVSKQRNGPPRILPCSMTWLLNQQEVAVSLHTEMTSPLESLTSLTVMVELRRAHCFSRAERLTSTSWWLQ